MPLTFLVISGICVIAGKDSDHSPILSDDMLENFDKEDLEQM